jgi:hypothetical protein
MKHILQRIRTSALFAVVALLLAACAQTPTVPAEDPAMLQPKPVVVAPVVPPMTATPPVVATPPPAVAATPVMPPQPVGTTGGTVPPSRGQPSAAQIATAPSVTPTGTTRYQCVTGSAASQTRVAIVFPENSGRICARFPAMGPCQYERDACRASGGRVIRFDGAEITKEVEKEYDKQVQRFRLNAG